MGEIGGQNPSSHMGLKAAQTLYYASEQATRIALPFTHWVTINFASTSVDPRHAPGCFSKLRRDHFNKWATRPTKKSGNKAIPPTYAYVFENVRDGVVFDSMKPGDPHNVHVHWLVHVHPRRAFDFGNQLEGWLRATAGEILGDTAIKITSPIPNLTNLRGYMLKGAKAAPHFGSTHRPQGLIIGKRSGTSINIGPSARRALDRALGVRRRIPARPRAVYQESPS